MKEKVVTKCSNHKNEDRYHKASLVWLQGLKIIHAMAMRTTKNLIPNAYADDELQCKIAYYVNC